MAIYINHAMNVTGDINGEVPVSDGPPASSSLPE